MHNFLGELSSLPGVFWSAALAWWAQPIYQCAWDLLKAAALIIAAAEIGKYLGRLLFGRKSRLVRIVEGLEDDLKSKNEEISRLKGENTRLSGEMKEAYDRLPET